MNIENPIAYRFIMQDELYLLNKEKTLYGTHTAPQSVDAPPPVNFKSLGQHKKKFLIVVYYPELEFIAGNHLVALENTLKRMELSLDDVSVFNAANHPAISIEQLMGFFKPQKLLLLGEGALPLGMETIILNKPQQLNNCNVLFSFSFDEMMDNNNNKKAFWEQMKQL